MIRYIKDVDRIYDDEFICHLRQYNMQYTGPKVHEKRYFYVLDNKELKASVSVSYSWDWVTIKTFFYLSKVYLRTLIESVWDYYKDQAVGIKFFTAVKETLGDFVDAGFIPTKTLETASKKVYYYADLCQLEQRHSTQYEVIHREEALEEFSAIAQASFQAYKERYQLNDDSEEIQIVALDDDKFAAGIRAQIDEDTMHVSLLVVVKKYRQQYIGSHLMKMIEDIARHQKVVTIELGTTDFQAKGFYEKNGYQVAYIRPDNPRGFKNYTMVKDL